MSRSLLAGNSEFIVLMEMLVIDNNLLWRTFCRDDEWSISFCGRTIYLTTMSYTFLKCICPLSQHLTQLFPIIAHEHDHAYMNWSMLHNGSEKDSIKSRQKKTRNKNKWKNNIRKTCLQCKKYWQMSLVSFTNGNDDDSDKTYQR